MHQHAAKNIITGAAYDERFWSNRLRITAFNMVYPVASEAGRIRDWSFKHLQRAGDAKLHTHDDVVRFLPGIAHELGTKEILCPVPTQSNTTICMPDKLLERIVVRSAMYHVTLCRGRYADGVLLGHGKTFGISAAGCPVIIVFNQANDGLAVAHASRQSLIDEGHWSKPPNPRRDASVIDNLIRETRSMRSKNMSQVCAIIAFPISPLELTYRWDDPKYGELNRARSTFLAREFGVECVPGFGDPDHEQSGEIDLGLVAKAQLLRHGVHEEHIEIIAPPEHWHTTRGTHPEKRNLILVKRY